MHEPHIIDVECLVMTRYNAVVKATLALGDDNLCVEEPYCLRLSYALGIFFFTSCVLFVFYAETIVAQVLRLPCVGRHFTGRFHVSILVIFLLVEWYPLCARAYLREGL